MKKGIRARGTSATARPKAGGVPEAAPGRGASGLWRWLIPVLLIAVGVAAYHNSFDGAFVLDDRGRIVDNSQIRRLWPPWEVMAHVSRPLVELSLAVNYAVDGLNVRGYHAFNLAVHLLAGLLLFGVVRRTLEGQRLRARYGHVAPGLAMAVAGLWLVHPLQTESVTYIIQRAESLMGLFFLLTLYCVIRGSLSPRSLGWNLAAVAACALGMGTKEVMVVAPILTLLYDRAFLSNSFADIFRRRGGLYAGLAATWGVLGALLATSRVVTTSRVEEQIVLVEGLTPWRYAMTQSGVIVHYLRLAVWPDPLVLDYGWPLAATLASIALPGAVVVALVGATAWQLRWRPWLGFLGAWFFLILAPTSSVLPIADIAFEHRMYLPLAAVIALVVIGTHEVLGSFLRLLAAPDGLRRWLEVGLLLVAVVALQYATVRRNEDYRSSLSIWRDTVAKRPRNPRAHNGLAAALEQQGNSRDAIAHFSEALRLKPDYAQVHTNLGSALLKQGQPGEAAAHCSEALRLKANYAEAELCLGTSLYHQGRAKEAIGHLSEALRLSETQGLKSYLAEAHHNLALALDDDKRISEAMAHYSEALRLNPDYAEAHNNVGASLFNQGRIGEAIPHFTEAVRLRPDFVEAHNNLGASLYKQGRIKEAVPHFSEALRLRPGYTEALDNLRRAQAAQNQLKDKP